MTLCSEASFRSQPSDIRPIARAGNRWSAVRCIATGAAIAASVMGSMIAVGSPASAQTFADEPTAVSAQLTSPTQITVTWVPPVNTGGSPVTAYRVFTSPGTAKPVQVPAEQTFARFDERKPGISYAYFVRAVTAAGEGRPSAWTPFVTAPKAGLVSVNPSPSPAAVTVTASGTDEITVNWTPPLTVPAKPRTIVAYRIEQNPGAAFITVPASSTFARFSKLNPSTNYIFSVQTVLDNKKQSLPALSRPIVLNPPSPSTTTLPAQTSVATGNAASVTAAPASSVVTTTAPPAVPSTTLLPLPPVVEPVGVGSTSTCVKTAWPSFALGQPAQLRAGAQAGLYVWFDGRAWQLRAYNPGPTPVVFSGTVSVNAASKFYPTFTEAGDVIRATSAAASYSFNSNYDIDAVRVTSGCARSLAITVRANGVPLPASKIFLGSTGTHPPTDGALRLVR